MTPAEHIDQIPIVTVSYNAPDLIEALLRTLRQFCPNPVYVIDGSRPEVAAQIDLVTQRYQDVRFIPFGYNIHHGPGMAWAINNLDLQGRVLFLDSDVEILHGDFLSSLDEHLKPHMYGVGDVARVTEAGIGRPDGNIPYLHPACMLCNVEVMRQWPLPIKHGAPMLQTMIALQRANRSDLVGNVNWVLADFGAEMARRYIKHHWQGTVKRTGGYHYDLPDSGAAVDPVLLALAPADAQKIVDIGCGDGSYAKAYKQRNPVCNYTGVERNAALADKARPHCDFVFNEDIEQASPQLYRHVAQADLWILGGVLSEVRDPWAVLAAIRQHCAPNARLLVSFRNFQHWSMQARLSGGDIRYVEGGALQRQELRVYTRGSMLEMLAQSGFRLLGGSPVIKENPAADIILPLIRQLAAAAGANADLAVDDARASEFVIIAQAI